jgi:PTH1 family peptidyl-tRNA hydrolase
MQRLHRIATSLKKPKNSNNAKAGGDLLPHLKLIVGLGNPGTEYVDTRHNAGIWFLDHLDTQSPVDWHRDARFFGLTAKLNQCTLLKPTTFMNDSGRAVAAFARFYKITPSEILIAHDELDLPVGTIRLKWAGGHGGHNGLRSIIEHLGSNDFYRLRIGIAHPGHKDGVTSYVLSKPSSADRQKILTSIADTTDIIPDLLGGDIQKAMQILHRESSQK